MRVLFHAQELLKEIIRISKFRIDSVNFAELERLRERYSLEWSEIDPDGFASAAARLGAENQIERARRVHLLI